MVLLIDFHHLYQHKSLFPRFLSLILRIMLITQYWYLSHQLKAVAHIFLQSQVLILNSNHLKLSVLRLVDHLNRFQFHRQFVLLNHLIDYFVPLDPNFIGLIHLELLILILILFIPLLLPIYQVQPMLLLLLSFLTLIFLQRFLRPQLHQLVFDLPLLKRFFLLLVLHPLTLKLSLLIPLLRQFW